MLFRRLRKSATLVLKSMPTTAKFSEESEGLAEKCKAQVAWMNQKGITGGLRETDRMPPRRAPTAAQENSKK